MSEYLCVWKVVSRTRRIFFVCFNFIDLFSMIYDQHMLEIVYKFLLQNSSNSMKLKKKNITYTEA